MAHAATSSRAQAQPPTDHRRTCTVIGTADGPREEDAAVEAHNEVAKCRLVKY